MSSRPRRGVKFPHKYVNDGHGRRPSVSDVGEDGAMSPTKTKSASTLPHVQERTERDRPRSEYETKRANFLTRTFWTFVMIAIFFGSLFMGHVYILFIITVIQIICFKEVIAIAEVPIRERDLRSANFLNWYWLGTTMYFLYGESTIYYFRHIVLLDKVLNPLVQHHRFISFSLYVFGFLVFVGTLKGGNLKFQFAQFGWTHMALYLIIVQAHFIMNNIFEGMIWFFMPTALVITNDIWAYICGITFGRTQLIKLSPKKTVEGFVGAWVMTVILGVLFTNVLSRSKYFICPVNNLGANFFTGLECDPNPVFLPHTYSFPDLYLLPFPTDFTLTMAPMQMHTFFLATFTSLVAPFGGFFASGLKRAFKMKDFGHSIPGHGGMTDRMDCQFIMGFFTYMYYHTFIAPERLLMGTVLQMAVKLPPEEQRKLLLALARYLDDFGAVPSHVSLEPRLAAYRVESGLLTSPV